MKLYDDEISINGTLYEGSYGESILAENGIFLYEDGIVLEGKTKADYEREKAERKKAETDAEDERNRRRYSRSTGIDYRNARRDENGHTIISGDKNVRDQLKRVEKSNKMYCKEVKNRHNKFTDKLKSAADESEKGQISDATKQGVRDSIKNLKNIAKPGGYVMNKDDFSLHSTGDNRQALNKVRDPINRHMRRHPKQYAKNESTIFSNVEII